MMQLKSTFALILLLGLYMAVLASERATSGYQDIQGLNVYYEIHGRGRPTLVLHGAYMSTQSMRPTIEALAKTRKVIALDLQGHGRTADIDRPISYEAMADDAAALLSNLNIEQADVFGYSMGGGIAYQLAIRHPERVRRIAAAAATYTTEGMYPALVQMIGEMTPESFAGSPWEAEYHRIAPNPDAFPSLVEKLVALDTTPQDWPKSDMRAIAAPTLVISGDADIVRPEHSVEIYRLRGGGPAADFMTPAVSELAILPGTSHLGVIEKTELVVPMVTAFFDKEIPSSVGHQTAGSRGD